MITEFITLAGDQINILHADRVYAGRLVSIEDPSEFEYAVLCDIDNKTHALATTGRAERDRQKAIFHANAIKTDIKLSAAS